VADEKQSFEMTRRAVIAGATLVPVAALTAPAQAPERALTAPEKQILEAFVDRLCPKDELGPGAVECGAANYIDIQLAGYLAGEKEAIVSGLAAVDAYARSAHGRPFTGLSQIKRTMYSRRSKTARLLRFPTREASSTGCGG